MRADQPTEDSGVANSALVHCLALDMIGGTRFGLSLTQDEYRAWTLALPKQLKRHWDALDLSDAMLKFEGDGWLVLTPESRLVKELCCLGLVMVRCFQDDMARMTGLTRDNIPALRAAITSGMDLSLSLPDGGRDWAGDSARRADRASGFCDGNTLLVSESVKQVVVRDFRVRLFDCAAAEHKPKRVEEPETLHELVDLSDAVAEQVTRALPSYVHVLGQTGRSEEGAALTANLLAAVDTDSAANSPEQFAASRGVANLGRVDKGLLERINIPRSVVAFNVAIGAAPDYQTTLDWFERMEAAGVTPDVVTFNTLVARATDYQTALDWFERMGAAEITPNVVTFNTLVARAPGYQTALDWFERMEAAEDTPDVFTFSTLVARAPDYHTALDWFKRMEAAGVTPNVFTFSTLVARAPDYQTALDWFKRMEAAEVTPNVVTFSSLVAQAPDYQMALDWFERMEAAGVTPNVVTFTTLFSKPIGETDPESIVTWYLGRKYHPESPVEALLANLRRSGDTVGITAVLLHYPHLAAARKIMRELEDEILKRLRDAYDAAPNEPNPPYALGLCLIEQGHINDAVPYLKHALKLARAGPRKNHLRDVLRRITK